MYKRQIAGENGEALATVERYDRAADAWEDVAPLAVARTHPGVLTVDDRLIVYGGELLSAEDAANGARDEARPPVVRELEVYDDAAQRWESYGMLPWSRRETRMQLFAAFALAVGGGAGGGARREQLHILFGRGAADDDDYYRGERPPALARYDERTRQWRALAPMHSIPTDVLGWSVRGDVAYVGVKDNATPARLVVERYCAGENAWRVVGSPVPLDVADHDDEVPFGIATLWAAE